MNIVFEPKIDVPGGILGPDQYDESIGRIPPDNFVVSRGRDGFASSTYGELSWNFSSYHPEEQPNKLNFEFWSTGEITSVREQLTRETRYLIFLLIWKRVGPPLSLGTLRNYLTVVNAIAKYSETVSCKIRDLLGNEKLLWSFIEYRSSGWMTETLGSLLPLLAKIGHAQLGFEIVGNKTLQAIRIRGRQYRTTLKQHSPIPTRIYSKIIAGLSEELSEWEPVAAEILSIVSACGKNPRLGRTVEQQYMISKRLKIPHVGCLTFKQIATPQCLDYFASKSLHPNVKSLSALISEIQLAAKLTIQTFSGMREDEAASLPYHCLETTSTNGKNHYIILGRTTKLNNGRAKRTHWVTNQDGCRAIKIARQIADTIYEVLGISPQKLKTHTNFHPLFVSVSYLGLIGGSLNSESNRYRAGHINLERMKRFRERLEPVIEEIDIRELEDIDPHRAWRSEEQFQVGKPWRFTSHQLRRSLALYAQRSGLVSLPSLRRQLQHITDEMSRYYSRGSDFAKNFIGTDKNHFGREWQNTQPESAALSYILNVLLSNDILFGGHANWIEHRLKNPSGTILVDRTATLRQFKKGEINYRETLFGGCTTVGECGQPALNLLRVDCLRDSCRNLVGNMKKLERVIAAQEKLVCVLDQNSIEYRTEKADLEVLVKVRDVILQKKGVNVK